MKYLDFLASTSDGKLTVTHILTKPPPIWRGLTGHIDDNILFNWISKYYKPAIPSRINIPTAQSASHSQLSQIPLQIPSSPPQIPSPNVNNFPLSTTPSIDDNYNWQMRSTFMNDPNNECFI